MSSRPPASELRRCIKCGREIATDDSMCAVCNRAGMVTPSASQYHGTIAVAIVVAVAALAWFAGSALEGVGPYRASVEAVTAGVTEAEYRVAYVVTNDGTKAGRAKCQVVAVDDAGRRLGTANALSPQVDGGVTVEASITLPDLAESPADVSVRCS